MSLSLLYDRHLLAASSYCVNTFFGVLTFCGYQSEQEMHTVKSIIDVVGGQAKLALILKIRPGTISMMQARRSIPLRYWPAIVSASNGIVSWADLIVANLDRFGLGGSDDAGRNS